MCFGEFEQIFRWLRGKASNGMMYDVDVIVIYPLSGPCDKVIGFGAWSIHYC